VHALSIGNFGPKLIVFLIEMTLGTKVSKITTVKELKIQDIIRLVSKEFNCLTGNRRQRGNRDRA